MVTVNMHEAKSHLSRLVKDVRDGTHAEIVIALDGVPAARLLPYEAPPARSLGIDRGLVTIAEDFDEPNADIARAFEA